ncbi:MAG: cytochrome C [Anaerolineales bacterium]|nr:cytochrome C [Anaerolineae bacterium]PWB74015.1 MAG: cytochrome C [Anaerolineales bacterium]
MKKTLTYILLVGVIIFGLIQLLPIGKNHTNPPTVSEPNWNSPETRTAVKEHCFQCHSNETEWPWYSNIAPASWLIYADVREGRAHFNFSDWGAHPGELDEMINEINEGGMPPIQYWIFHPNSRLSDTQKQSLISGLQATLQR